MDAPLKKVCYFGIYDPLYARNKNIIAGLRENGIAVVEITDVTPGIRKFLNLYRKYRALKDDFDVMIVGFPGQIMVPFARIICRNKPIVFDLHVSYYDSIILERHKYKKFSLQAAWFYFLDQISCRLAHRILLDTKEHVEYVSKLLHIGKEKFLVVYHGIDDKLFRASGVKPKDNDREGYFTISFHGYIQPLNGMELVIKAMELLKDEKIKLWVIGGGVDYGKIKDLSENILKLKNVEFFPPMRPELLIEKISDADIGLGFFSQSKKIDRVIANKVYELMALKIPVLTGNSIASQEHFKHREHVYYCDRGSVDSIVDGIRALKKDALLRERISKNAYEYVKKNLNPGELGKKLIRELSDCIKEFNPIELQ